MKVKTGTNKKNLPIPRGYNGARKKNVKKIFQYIRLEIANVHFDAPEITSVYAGTKNSFESSPFSRPLPIIETRR
jgi:hypothetical protein